MLPSAWAAERHGLRRVFAPEIHLILSGALMVSLSAAPGEGRDDSPVRHEVTDGWSVFVEKACIQCHAVWGMGGNAGPDLGRAEQLNSSAAGFVASMWNHVPKVNSHMQRERLEFPRLGEQEASELFSFLFFIQYLGEPGDVDRGQSALVEKGCADCHATDGHGLDTAPDLRRWATYVNPIVWAQKMWEHAPRMEQAMRERGMTWPQLEDSDLVNIVAYLRSIGGSDTTVYLRPGSPESGMALFNERGCNSCHSPSGSAPDLGAVSAPRSLTSLAARMWNHSPQMTRMMEQRNVDRSSMSAQDMADIVAYLVFLRYEDKAGEPQRGRIVFESKHCAQCHGANGTQDEPAPAIQNLSLNANPIRAAAAMWNHGLSMMEQMGDVGMTWPMFTRDEMNDVLAYFASVRPPETRSELAAPTGTLATAYEGPRIELGRSCVTPACHFDLVSSSDAHSASRRGQCMSCHALADVDRHLFDLVDTTAELCYQCHDRPAESPLASGNLPASVCASCHRPHGGRRVTDSLKTQGAGCFSELIGVSAMLENEVEGRNLLAAEVRSHAPSVKPSNAPGDLTATKRTQSVGLPGEPVVAAPPAPGRVITVGDSCVTDSCHPRTLAERFTHPPASQGQCDVCHVPGDTGNHTFALLAPEPDLCHECHESHNGGSHVHGPVATGLCTVCHDPHGSSHPRLLPEEGSELCYMCHVEMRDHVDSSSEQHAVLQQEGCERCHDPHSSAHPYQLKVATEDLCFECHSEVKEAIAKAVVSHDPVTTNHACANCHNPHGSNVPAMLVGSEMSLCLNCHDQPLETPHGPIADMKSLIAAFPERHGPIRDGSCVGCHEPHGSANFRILRYGFPREFYAPFAIEKYDLCFQCHEATLVLSERTTSLTQFRNGDHNLHFVHVNQEKGRTCRACHEIHAGANPRRIKDEVPFGRWAYPINFEISEDGGRCEPGCHIARAYDRRQEIIQN